MVSVYNDKGVILGANDQNVGSKTTKEEKQGRNDQEKTSRTMGLFDLGTLTAENADA